ncbi:MAG: ATP synthase F1 subunit delta [Mangrovibacterium sp.]|nr:ATP synthase F1 subunit delta [Mangrovibacterium sp.]
MDQTKIATRYAKAFFSLAREKGRLDLLKEDMDTIGRLCGESPDFKLLLESPALKTSRKIKLFDSILGGKVQDDTLNFIRLITHNKREAHLPGICRNFTARYREDKGIQTAVLTGAVALSRTTVEQIRSFLETELKSDIEMSVKVDPDLIGGFVLRVGDKQLDASILNQLKKMKVTLLETE